MKTTSANNKTLLKRTLLSSAVATLLSTSAAYACDSCTELTTISDNTTQISSSLTTLDSLISTMQGILTASTGALFGSLPDNDYSPAEFSAIPAVQSAAHNDETSLLNAVETNFRGTYEENKTAENAYNNIFGSYLMQNSDGSDSNASFDTSNASASSLFLDPGETGYYTDDQQTTAETYIQLLSGAAVSTQRAPDKSWLHNDNSKERKYTRSQVSQYFTMNAIQSLVADNLSYIYSLNTGHPVDGDLGNYQESSISESGLIKYIQQNKVENPSWYTDIGMMAISALLQEQVILTAGAFLELTRIEDLMKRQLAMQSASTSTSLIMMQGLAEQISKMNKPS